MTRLRATQKPVVEIDDGGNKVWKVDGVLHRDDGPAVERACGSQSWWRCGQRHREDGPAVEYASGVKEWYRHGQLHREDGPAVEYPDGTHEWYLRSQQYTKPEWLREVLKDRPITVHQRELLHALSENWAGTSDALYETVAHLSL